MKTESKDKPPKFDKPDPDAYSKLADFIINGGNAPKSKVWHFDTMSRTFTKEFDEPVYAQVALTAFCKETGLPANAVSMIYS